MRIPDGWRRLDVQASVVLVLLTLFVLAVFIDEPSEASAQNLMIAAWVGWALVPPAYFLFDWSRFTSTNTDDLARLKYNHELSSKFWIAGVSVLSGVLLHYLPDT